MLADAIEHGDPLQEESQDSDLTWLKPGPRHRPGDGVPAQEAVNILQWWEYSPRQIVRILARQCLYLTIRRRAFLLGEDTLGYL